MIVAEDYVLNNGVAIPKLAFGTWQIPLEETSRAVCAAIKAGYRHIDTAVAYGNEQGVAEGIRSSGAQREKLFITTKIPAEVKSYGEAKKSIEDSLSNLSTSYIDLLLIHAPKPWSEMFAESTRSYFDENLAVWKAMQEAYAAGIVRAIGVSNFRAPDLENLRTHSSMMPMANQIRVHVGHVPHELLDLCRDGRILVMAYSPFATGRLKDHPVVVDLAQKYGVSAAQLCIRFCLQLGTLPVIKSVREDRIEMNTKVDFEIHPEDMQKLLSVEEVGPQFP